MAGIQKAPNNKKLKTTPSKSNARSLYPIERATSLIHTICCISGSPDFLANLREAGGSKLTPAIEQQDTGAIYDWIIDALSYQGISDAVAFSYMERHGRVTWASIAMRMARTPSCPKLQNFWAFTGCRYNKSNHTCSAMDHIRQCPLPRYKLRNGGLNQTAFSLYLFMRDVALCDLVGWIDRQLEVAARGDHEDDLASKRESLIGPLRQVVGAGDKTLSMSLSMILLSAPKTKPDWFEVGIASVAIDTLVHNFLHRTGILFRLDAEHRYGVACYRNLGCADILYRIARRIDARQFNSSYPRTFPRFVQHAVWQFCAQQGHDICNGNNIDDYARCENASCQLFQRCDRKQLHVARPQVSENVSSNQPPSKLATRMEIVMTKKKPTKPAKAKSVPKQKPRPKPAQKKLVDPDAPVFVLFGRDQDEKPCAARLPGFNPDLVHRAARIMGYRAIETTVGDSGEILKRLPLGRIFADGKALAPPVSQDTYELIIKAVGDDLKISNQLPKSWDELAPGHLVLAEHSASDGWWIAVVVEREGNNLKIKWRDFPIDEPLVRHVDALALIGSSG